METDNLKYFNLLPDGPKYDPDSGRLTLPLAGESSGQVVVDASDLIRALRAANRSESNGRQGRLSELYNDEVRITYNHRAPPRNT